MEILKNIEGIEELEKNILSVYDYDSYSLNDLLCKFFTKINECVLIGNTSLDFLTYLKSEGVPKEVAKILNNWVTDGTMSRIINQELFQELNNKIDFKTRVEVVEYKPNIPKENTVYFIKGQGLIDNPNLNCLKMKLVKED